MITSFFGSEQVPGAMVVVGWGDTLQPTYTYL
jgi:hypothetical protein